ncbi:MAG: iron-containing alcohol dehydrogenase family protein, partial [Desulfovibrionaceae bacterium]
MSEQFRFQLKTDVRYGAGWSMGLGDFLGQAGRRRVAVLVDEGCARHSEYYPQVLSRMESVLDSVEVVTLRGTEEPDYDYLDSVADQVKALGRPDVLVGVGGGSCLDVTKAVAVLLTNPGKGIDYRGFDKVKVPGVPTVCIPTTAGTGSEVTINAVFTDKQEMKKLGVNGQYLNATWAVLDAEWTMSCPHHVAVSSGMDAMTHALESFTCKQHNAMTRALSREAFKTLYENLPCLADDPENRDKRQQLLLGSYLAAAALFNSGSGIAGALSYPIGVHYKVPHGIGGAVFLASVAEYNVERGYTDYAELLDMVEPHPDWTPEQKSRRFVEALRELADKVGVPRTLEQWGITAENVEQVGVLMHPLHGAFDQNPVA